MHRISWCHCTLFLYLIVDESTADIALCGHFSTALTGLFKKYDLEIIWVNTDEKIPGSFWGEPEAGLIANRLYLRDDTPVHSAFHEACHYICMDETRRHHLDTNAGGDTQEENAVCYLQILLADHLENYDRKSMMKDMDQWGYSFRLGSSERWFLEDADDAVDWLHNAQLIDANEMPSWNLRT